MFSHCIFFFYGFPVFVGIWRRVGSGCGSTVLSQLPLQHICIRIWTRLGLQGQLRVFFVFSHCILLLLWFPCICIWGRAGCGSTVLSQLPLRHKLSPVGNQACHNAKNNCHQLPSLAVPAKNTGLSLSTKEPKYELMAHSSKSCILQKPKPTMYWRKYFYRVLTEGCDCALSNRMKTSQDG